MIGAVVAWVVLLGGSPASEQVACAGALTDPEVARGRVGAGLDGRDACALHGRIQFVTAFADVDVQFVDAFPDLRVQFVDAFPDRPGRWQVVQAFPDYKVRVVEHFPDLKVKVVTAFPGCD